MIENCKNCKMYKKTEQETAHEGYRNGMCRFEPVGVPAPPVHWCSKYEANLEIPVPEVVRNMGARDLLRLFVETPHVKIGDKEKIQPLIDRAVEIAYKKCLHKGPHIAGADSKGELAAFCWDCNKIME